MTKKITDQDFKKNLEVINQSAIVYKGKIPVNCWKEPYMPVQELKKDIDGRVQFYGYLENNRLIAVMAIQPVKDVTLIRHAYTIPSRQRQGKGKILLNYLLLNLARTQRVLVGTWESAPWTIKFYQKHGFQLLSREETNNLLKKYWNIPNRQVETSVVLELKRLKS
jgi:GNAT superfamily N-acetyltransferase